MTNKAYEQALRFLAIRNHSSTELKNKLFRKGYSEDEIADVLEDLSNKGWVDDESLAQRVFEHYVEEGVYGNSYIAYKMAQKGLIMPQQMSAEQELSRAEALVRKKLLRPGLVLTRRKLASFLANRGYGSSVVRGIIEILGDAVYLDSVPKKSYNGERQS